MLTVLDPANFDWAGMSLFDCARGNAVDSYFTLKLFNLFEEKLGDLECEPLITKVINPLLPIFAKAEFNGVNVHKENLKKVAERLFEKNIEGCDDLYKFKQVSTKYSMASPADVCKVLFEHAYRPDDEGFGLYPPIWTATDNPSSSRDCLELLIDQIENELRTRKDG